MARRRSSHGSTGRTTGRRTTTTARRSAGLKSYWRSVHAVARRLDKPIKDARAIVREARSRDLTHTDIRKLKPQRAGALLRSDRAKAPARFRLKRERDTAVEFPFGANVERPATMPAPAELVPIENLADWIDIQEDAEDYEDDQDIEIHPDETRPKK